MACVIYNRNDPFVKNDYRVQYTYIWEEYYYRNDFQHLLSRNEPVAVQVVHAERPFQFLFQFSARRHRQGAKELPEVDGAIAVRVERSEHVLCKLVWAGEERERERERERVVECGVQHFPLG